MNHEEWMVTQWSLKHNFLKDVLEEVQFKGEESEHLLSRIRQNHKSIKSIFTKLTATHNRPVSHVQNAVFLETQEMLKNQFVEK